MAAHGAGTIARETTITAGQLAREVEVEANDPQLMTGEEIVFQTKKHWFAPVADSWKAVLLILGALVLAWLQTEQTAGVMGFVNRVLNLLEIALMLGGIGLIVYNIVAWRSAEYVLTNRRVLGQEGLLRKRQTDSLLTAISDVRMRVTGLGGMLHYGNLQLLTASGEAGVDNFTTVRDAVDFKKAILEQKIAAENAKGAQAVAPAASGGAAPADPQAALNALNNLHASGAITDDEYNAKKAEVLARI